MKSYYISTVMPYRNVQVQKKDFKDFIDYASRHYTITKDEEVVDEGTESMQLIIAYYGTQRECRHPSKVLLGLTVYEGMDDEVPFL